MNEIIDFEIRKSNGGNGRYDLSVVRRAEKSPLATGSFDLEVSSLTKFAVGELEQDGRDPHRRMERFENMGGRLYGLLFSEEIREVWESFKREADFLSLCLRISPDAAEELEMLPWEALYDGERFLAAGADTGVFRLPLNTEPVSELSPVPLPLEVLAFISSPLDLAEHERLQMEREQEILLQAISGPSAQGAMKITFEDEAKLTVLEQALDTPYSVFHYSGHGISPKGGGGLLLEDAEGKKRPSSVRELMTVMEKGLKHFRLAVISGCQTAAAAGADGFPDIGRELIRRGVPAALAMQFSIGDEAGLKFAEVFFGRLAEGAALNPALTAARRALLLSDNPFVRPDAFAPVLFAAHPHPLNPGPARADAPRPDTEIDFSVSLPFPSLDFAFYGRRREYRRLRDALILQGQRAVIVHGLGGIGKTALASHGARRLSPGFKGVYGFDCGGGAVSPETILLELHEFLSLQGTTSLGQLVHKVLPPERMALYTAQVLEKVPLLLVFDNFEKQLADSPGGPHVIAGEELRRFLVMLVKTTGRGTRFIFTSRYAFDLGAERVGAIREIPLREMSRPEALQLMQKLPHLSSAGFSEMKRAYRVFGGHPYALVILDRHCRFSELSKVLDAAASVHGELREFTAIEMSWEKLAEEAKNLLERLAAFRVPVLSDAAGWVTGEQADDDGMNAVLGKIMGAMDPHEMPDALKGIPREQLLQVIAGFMPQMRKQKDVSRPLSELVRWGLVAPMTADDGIKKLAVHNLVRDFVRERAGNKAWKDRLADAAAFYTHFSSLIPDDKKTPELVMNEMEAFELLMEAEEFSEAADLLMAADPLMDRWGLGRVIELKYRRVIDRVDRAQRSKLLHNLAILIAGRGEYDKALEMYRESLEVKKSLGDRAGVSTSMHQIGMIHQYRGEYDKALEMYRESLDVKKSLGDRAGVSKSMHQIGRIHQERGEYDKALEMYRESLEVNKSLGDRAGVSTSMHQIGRIHQERGEYDKALEMYRESLEVAKSLGDRAGVSKSMHNIGRIHQERGEYDKALEMYRESLEVDKSLGDRAGVSKSMHQIGRIHQKRGEYDKALEMYRESLEVKKSLGDRAGMASSMGQMGQLFAETGNHAEALDLLAEAFSIFQQLRSPSAGIAKNALKDLREKWGAENFDPAFEKKTGMPFEEFLERQGFPDDE